MNYMKLKNSTANFPLERGGRVADTVNSPLERGGLRSRTGCSGLPGKLAITEAVARNYPTSWKCKADGVVDH